MKRLVDVAGGSLVVVPSGQVGCASGVGLKSGRSAVPGRREAAAHRVWRALAP